MVRDAPAIGTVERCRVAAGRRAACAPPVSTTADTASFGETVS